VEKDYWLALSSNQIVKLDVTGGREAVLNRCLRPSGDSCHQTEDENYQAAE
jgi:hypothetical protein